MSSLIRKMAPHIQAQLNYCSLNKSWFNAQTVHSKMYLVFIEWHAITDANIAFTSSRSDQAPSKPSERGLSVQLFKILAKQKWMCTYET